MQTKEISLDEAKEARKLLNMPGGLELHIGVSNEKKLAIVAMIRPLSSPASFRTSSIPFLGSASSSRNLIPESFEAFCCSSRLYMLIWCTYPADSLSSTIMQSPSQQSSLPSVFQLPFYKALAVQEDTMPWCEISSSRYNLVCWP